MTLIAEAGLMADGTYGPVLVGPLSVGLQPDRIMVEAAV